MDTFSRRSTDGGIWSRLHPYSWSSLHTLVAASTTVLLLTFLPAVLGKEAEMASVCTNHWCEDSSSYSDVYYTLCIFQYRNANRIRYLVHVNLNLRNNAIEKS